MRFWGRFLKLWSVDVAQIKLMNSKVFGFVVKSRSYDVDAGNVRPQFINEKNHVAREKIFRQQPAEWKRTQKNVFGPFVDWSHIHGDSHTKKEEEMKHHKSYENERSSSYFSHLSLR